MEKNNTDDVGGVDARNQQQRKEVFLLRPGGGKPFATEVTERNGRENACVEYECEYVENRVEPERNERRNCSEFNLIQVDYLFNGICLARNKMTIEFPNLFFSQQK